MTEARHDRRRRIRGWSERIAKQIDTAAPSAILGHAIAALYHAAMADPDIGRIMMQWITETAMAGARQRTGYCQTCDARIPAIKTHHPHCGTCEGKQSAEFLRFEMENPYQEDMGDDPQA